MDDPDPLVTEDKVPGFELVEKKIKEIDNTIIIYRIYYLLNSFKFRFQLIKKDRMCILEIPRSLLESLNKNGTSSERRLSQILELNIDNAECWNEIKA